jgi:hypothetical protein
MAASARVPHSSFDERRAWGREAHHCTPPSAHAGWIPATDRRDPVALPADQQLPTLVRLVRPQSLQLSPVWFESDTDRLLCVRESTLKASRPGAQTT